MHSFLLTPQELKKQALETPCRELVTELIERWEQALLLQQPQVPTSYNSLLEWGPESKKSMRWEAGVTWCERLGERWRMPTLGELRLAWEDEETRKTFAQSVSYWSSSTYQDSPTGAWFVDFRDGYIYADGKTYNFYVRAVRSVSK